MIELLMFTKDFRGFKAKDMFIFMPGVNLLVGDQGCGKSTILQCIAAHANSKAFWKRDKEHKESSQLIMSSARKVFMHDFENDSGRTSPSFETMGQLPLEMSIAQMRMSHGQATNQIVSMLGDAKNAFLILDEPDMGLSPRSAIALAEAFKKAEKNGTQIIASVHNPWIIEAFDGVHSIEHRKWMKSKDFLEDQRKERAK